MNEKSKATKVEVLVATMNQNDFSLVKDMNIRTNAIIANQADCNNYKRQIMDNHVISMYVTDTKGVGINRNIGLLFAQGEYLLFSDDDMIYYDDYEEKVEEAFQELPDADVIIFSMEMKSGDRQIDAYINKTKKLNIFNIFKYGACTIAIRRSIVKQYNLHFTELFGGGCLYGSGEDSLFLMDCLKCNLKIYSHKNIIGVNTCKESTWFNGFNEKYFYDKGAWLCNVPLFYRVAMKYYFVFRFRNKTPLNWKKRLSLINNGIKGYKTMTTYEIWKKQK